MTRKVVLFIAMSIDGFIADAEGGVDWLAGEDPNHKGYEGYNEFIETIDTVILGMNTYKQIISELSPKLWPYKGMKSYVLTHREQENTKEIEFLNEDVVLLIKRLKQEEGKNIWICGGANIANQLIKQDAIDVYHITTIPVILGNGVRLFSSMNNTIDLHFVKSDATNGMIDTVYTRRVEKD